ncbi:MAG TPA: class 3 fructose-bisphosphatase [Lachnospiraceae bacterium]|jgi:fructose-1,6-bisphosphatase class 3|nr:MAG: fructose-1,6-bisphosphatase [Firmicutes bacterium CAG_194_44_15]HCI18864.1 class 3 fructose-bisphosphatase [Lachnospiraceae bacterium]HCX41209.1 class 3 fructose-bisphosphatase [Lachnospiraceae bacterium]
MDDMELRYLKSLSKQYPNIASASTEIINLQAILNLPKGTEHFMTDVHGEYEQFNHVLKNGSGSVRRKIDEEFGNTLSSKDKKSLATLIYYPKEKLEIVMQEEENIEDWYKITLYRLVQITKHVSSKYTRSKVRKALPKDFAYIIEELITEKAEVQDKEGYYNEIVHTIIRIGRAPDFIVALSKLIQRLVIDHLHIVGDIYDRGPGPHIILHTLRHYHSVDVQWGNHDIVWMGAAAGSLACIANVVRMSARYGNLDTLEEGYGINLIPLATFALEQYKNTSEAFAIKYNTDYNTKDLGMDMKMHKAMAVIQFKLEGQIIKRRPEFMMEDRLLLDKINFEKGTVMVEGRGYKMRDMDFPTIDPANPYELTPEETEVMERLRQAFTRCDKLQKDVRFLFSKGGLYKVYNSNLLYHGCVPLDEEGNFLKVNVFGKEYSGKALYDILDTYARRGYYASRESGDKAKGEDILWYIWTGPNSPVFGKDKMTTFERYFIEDKETHVETKNAYYRLYDNEEIVDKILREFGLDTTKSHIVNGHVPVERKKGESPIKCNGKLLVIDGGFSKAYQHKTGIAGYTLVANSYGMRLVSHEPFESTEAAIRKESDIFSDSIVVETALRRQCVADTDIGVELKESIHQLEELLDAYREGVLVEKNSYQ